MLEATNKPRTDQFEVYRESALYRRDGDSNTSFVYHNHILCGNVLHYMRKPLKQGAKEVSRFRLVFVQGTRKGRLVSLRLSQNSEVKASAANDYMASKTPLPYIINVSGVDMEGRVKRWQLATSSKEDQRVWIDALIKAKELVEKRDNSGESEQLRVLVQGMKAGMKLGSKFYRFKYYSNCFSGRQACLWIMKHKAVSSEAAVRIGLKLVDLGLIQHVANEHMFYDGKLLYHFCDHSRTDLDNYLGPFRALSKLHRQTMADLKASQLASGLLKIQVDGLNKALQATNRQVRKLRYRLRKRDILLALAQLMSLIWVCRHIYRNADKYSEFYYSLCYYCVGLSFSALTNTNTNTSGNVANTHEEANNIWISWLLKKRPAKIIDGSISYDSNDENMLMAQLAMGIVITLISLAYIDSGIFSVYYYYTESRSTLEDEMLAAVSYDANAPLMTERLFSEEDIGAMRAKEIKDTYHDQLSSHQSSDKDMHSSATSLAALEEEEEDEEVELHNLTDIMGATHDDEDDEEEDEDDWGDEEEYDDDDDDELFEGDSDNGEGEVDGENNDDNDDDDDLFIRNNSGAWPSKEHSTFMVPVSASLPSKRRRASKYTSIKSAVELQAISYLNSITHLPHPVSWPMRGLMIRRAPASLCKADLVGDPESALSKLEPLPVHRTSFYSSPEELLEPIVIDSDFFEGFCYLDIADQQQSKGSKGVKSPLKKVERPKYQAVFQGKFKRPISFSGVYTGQAMDTGIDHLPAPLLVRNYLKLISRLQPAMRMNLKGSHPYALSPLVAAAQTLTITPPDKEPPKIRTRLDMLSLREDTAILQKRRDALADSATSPTSTTSASDTLVVGSNDAVTPVKRDRAGSGGSELGEKLRNKLGGGKGSLFPMTARQRRNYFSKRKNLRASQAYVFDTDNTYTFNFFQHTLDLASYQVDLGFIKYDLTRILGSRPIQFSVVAWDPVDHTKLFKRGRRFKQKVWPFVWNLEVWHPRSIPPSVLPFLKKTPNNTNKKN